MPAGGPGGMLMGMAKPVKLLSMLTPKRPSHRKVGWLALHLSTADTTPALRNRSLAAVNSPGSRQTQV